MAILSDRFYRVGKDLFSDVDNYRETLTEAFNKCRSQDERDNLLREELVELTRHITDGIRDILKQDRRLYDLVCNKGALPLATWTASLDKMAKESAPELEQKIKKMEHDLENCRVDGFTATMFLYRKPSFVTFNRFYKLIFEMMK